jgi:hypothetical protein
MGIFLGASIQGEALPSGQMFINGTSAGDPTTLDFGYSPAPNGNPFKIGQVLSSIDGANVPISSSAIGIMGFGFMPSVPSNGLAPADVELNAAQMQQIVQRHYNACVNAEDFIDDPAFNTVYSTRRGLPNLKQTWGPVRGTVDLERVGTEALSIEASPPRFANAASWFGCFIAGTKVWTPQGLANIEELGDGDVVYSWSEETGRICESPVVETFKHDPKPVFSVNTSDERMMVNSVVCTAQHPFYVKDLDRQVPAGELKATTELRSFTGESVSVSGVVPREQDAAVFNIRVADHHNYFVGPSGLLVHNK